MQLSSSETILTAYGAATAALGAANERFMLFPEPAILAARIRLAEQEALAWLGGDVFAPEQLAADYGSGPRAWRHWPFTFVRVFDRPLPGNDFPTAMMVEQWLGSTNPTDTPFPAPADLPIAIAQDRLAAWERRIAATAALPRLLSGADIAAAFARAAPLANGNLVIGAMLAERHGLPNSPLTAGGIAAMGMQRRRIPWLRLVTGGLEEAFAVQSEAARDARCRIAWLEALAVGAAAIIDLDKRMRLWWTRLDEVCAAKRKSSHLRALVLLAAAGPSLTVSRAAQTLSLSRQAASQLVAQAHGRQLLREITHGDAFRRYVIAI